MRFLNFVLVFLLAHCKNTSSTPKNINSNPQSNSVDVPNQDTNDIQNDEVLGLAVSSEDISSFVIAESQQNPRRHLLKWVYHGTSAVKFALQRLESSSPNGALTYLPIGSDGKAGTVSVDRTPDVSEFQIWDDAWPTKLQPIANDKIIKYRIRTVNADRSMGPWKWLGAPTEVSTTPWSSGFGASASGGRGGAVVYKVTNMEDQFDSQNHPMPLEGTLRYGMEVLRGPRTIVFEKGGYLKLTKTIVVDSEHGDVTIAGQTAPYPGVTIGLMPEQNISSHVITLFRANNVVLRNLKLRRGNSASSTYLAHANELNTKFCKYRLLNLANPADYKKFAENCEILLPGEQQCPYFLANTSLNSHPQLSAVRRECASSQPLAHDSVDRLRFQRFDFDPRAASTQVNGGALSLSNARNIMIDHVTATWGTDETIVIWNDGEGVTENVTVQNSIVADAIGESRMAYVYKGPDEDICPEEKVYSNLRSDQCEDHFRNPSQITSCRNYRFVEIPNSSNNQKYVLDMKCITNSQFYPRAHPLGSNIGGEVYGNTKQISVIRNLFANNRHRNPKMGASSAQIVQNWMTNWVTRASEISRDGKLDYIENVYEPRQSISAENPTYILDTGNQAGQLFLSGNVITGNFTNIPSSFKDAVNADQKNLLRAHGENYVECSLADEQAQRTLPQYCIPSTLLRSSKSQSPRYGVPSLQPAFASTVEFFKNKQFARVGASFLIGCDGLPIAASSGGDRGRDVIDQSLISYVKSNRVWRNKVYANIPKSIADVRAFYAGIGVPFNLEDVSSNSTSQCVDSDRDGLPDLWEARMGSTGLEFTANSDADKDGYSDLEEFLNCTDPRINDSGSQVYSCQP